MKPTAAKAKKTKAKEQPSTIAASRPVSDDGLRLECIATAAYYKAAGRGFTPGGEMDDWLAAEMEFEASVRSGSAQCIEA